MQTILRAALAGLLVAGMSSLAFGHRSAGGCQRAVTNVPWGTVDTSCVGGPPGPGGWTGGIGGPGMRISKEGHKNWPNYPGR